MSKVIISIAVVAALYAIFRAANRYVEGQQTQTATQPMSGSGTPASEPELVALVEKIRQTPRADRVWVAAPFFNRLIAERNCKEQLLPEMLASTWKSESGCGLGAPNKADGAPDKTNVEYIADSKTGAQGAFQVDSDTAKDRMKEGWVGPYDPQNFIHNARMAVRTYCTYREMFPGDFKSAVRAYGGGQKHLKQPKEPGSAATAAWSEGYWQRYSVRLEEYRLLIAANGVATMPAPVYASAGTQADPLADGVIRLYQPVPTGTLMSPYYDCRGDDCEYRHDAIDITCTMGEPVYAAAGGTVKVARDLSPDKAGIAVIIQHDGSVRGVVRTGYMHLSAVSVSQGQRVFAGQVVGACGDSGNAKGGPAHVHFKTEVAGANGKLEDANACWHMNCAVIDTKNSLYPIYRGSRA